MLKCFRIDTPFPVRIPFPTRRVPESNLLPPKLLTFEQFDDRGVVRMTFPPPTKWAQWSRNDVHEELYWSPKIRSVEEAFAWWQKSWVIQKEAERPRRLARFQKRIDAACDSQQHQRLFHLRDQYLESQKQLANRPEDWTIDHWMPPNGSGMRVWTCGDGQAVTFSSHVLDYVPGIPILLLISASNGTVMVPNGKLDFPHSDFTIGNPDHLYSPTLTSEPLDVTRWAPSSVPGASRPA